MYPARQSNRIRSAGKACDWGMLAVFRRKARRQGLRFYAGFFESATHQPPQFDPADTIASDMRIPGTKVSAPTLATILATELTGRRRLSLGRSDRRLVGARLRPTPASGRLLRRPSHSSSVIRHPAACAQVPSLTPCSRPGVSLFGGHDFPDSFRSRKGGGEPFAQHLRSFGSVDR